MFSWWPGKPYPFIFWKSVEVYRQFALPLPTFWLVHWISLRDDSGVGKYWRCEPGSHNVETGHSDLYSIISLFFKEQKKPIVYHVLVGLLSYRLLEFELQSYGVNPAVVSQGSSYCGAGATAHPPSFPSSLQPPALSFPTPRIANVERSCPRKYVMGMAGGGEMVLLSVFWGWMLGRFTSESFC